MEALERHEGVLAREVRTPAELDGCDAIILPGGESTAIGHGLVDAELLQPLREFVKTKPAWGVCAGLILLADRLDNGARILAAVGCQVLQRPSAPSLLRSCAAALGKVNERTPQTALAHIRIHVQLIEEDLATPLGAADGKGQQLVVC